MTGASKWRLNRRYEILSRVWGGQCVIYHNGSGHTHLLGLQAFELLQHLDGAAVTPGQLVARLASDWAMDENPELTEFVARTLRELQHIDLVETVSA